MGGKDYEIRVEGELGPSWQEWFEGMAITYEPGGRSVLRGSIVDQPALHGILNRLLNLNLKLISVSCSGREDVPSDEVGNERRGS